MAEKKSKKSKKSNRRGLVIPLLLIIGLVAVEVFPIRQIISQGRELEESRARLEVIQEENRRLEQQIQDWQTPAGIERMARADFGYVRPGDISYVVVAQDDEFPSGEAPQTAGSAPESGGFFQALWDYLTGRDMGNE